MGRLRIGMLVTLAFAAGTRVWAQTAEVSGKVLDVDGKPVANAEVSVSCDAFPDRIYKGTSDKRGNYFVSGVVTSQQAGEWKIGVKAAGLIPLKASLIARMPDKTRYFDDEPKLTAKSPWAMTKIKDLAIIHVDFTMRTGDAEAEASAGGIALPPPPPAEGSVDLFKKAIEAKPDDWERRDLFARVLLRLDRAGEATIQANKAAAAAPDKAGPQLTLTEIYLARGLPDKAAESIAKAQALEPDNVKVLERSANVAAQAGKLDEALALNEKVLAKKPDSTEAMVAMADIYNRKKQPKKAEEMLAKVVELDPKNAYRTFYNLGAVISNRDDLTDADNRKAIESFRKAINLKPDYAVAHRDLGFALLRAGDKADLIEARKELAKYIDLEPHARDAADIKATIKSLEGGK